MIEITDIFCRGDSMEKTVFLTDKNSTDILKQLRQTENKTEDKTEKSKEKKNIFAGELNLIDDPVTQKRKEAQKKAMKVVQDAWDSDRAIDKDVQDRREHYEKMDRLRSEAQDEVMQINKEKQAVKEFYGVEDDSKEQQDLELLCKREDYMNGDFDSALTKEEWDRIAEIEKEPLTEYQKQALELHKRAGYFQGEIREAEKQMKDDAADIRSIQIERLKYQPMTEAQKNAKEIRENASKEIIGMLQQEALDRIDEEMEEAKEKAEEAAEKKEEEEEKLEEKLEKKLAELKQDDVKQSIEEIKVSMNLLDTDLKGIQVDEEI